jgi:hypothetical protein
MESGGQISLTYYQVTKRSDVPAQRQRSEQQKDYTRRRLMSISDVNETSYPGISTQSSTYNPLNNSSIVIGFLTAFENPS